MHMPSNRNVIALKQTYVSRKHAESSSAPHAAPIGRRRNNACPTRYTHCIYTNPMHTCYY